METDCQFERRAARTKYNSIHELKDCLDKIGSDPKHTSKRA